MTDEKQMSFESIIEQTVSEVAPPSPVADMPEASTVGQTAAGVSASSDNAASINPTVKRGRGRPRKNGDAGPASSPRPKLEGVKPSFHGVGVTSDSEKEQAGIDAAASTAVMLVSMSGMMLGGEEAAINKDEAMLAKDGFTKYFMMKGVNNIPPWVILAGGLAPYYLRILSTTPARTTISNASGRIWFRLKEWWKGLKNARSNSWNNTKRENNVSAQTGEASV